MTRVGHQLQLLFLWLALEHSHTLADVSVVTREVFTAQKGSDGSGSSPLPIEAKENDVVHSKFVQLTLLVTTVPHHSFRDHIQNVEHKHS